MRDPGTPGRNPFFDHGPGAELADLGHLTGDLGEDALAPGSLDAASSGPDGPGPGYSDGSDPWTAGGGVDPLGTLAALVDALQGAQPEATEHLVAAAHELVLAVKTVVDATEAVLAAQRAVPRASPAPPPVPTEPRPTDAPDSEPPRDPFSSDEPPPSSRTSGVRRIDLA